MEGKGQFPLLNKKVLNIGNRQKGRILTKNIISNKESDRFLKDFQKLKEIKAGKLKKLNIVINKSKLKRNRKVGIF